MSIGKKFKYAISIIPIAAICLIITLIYQKPKDIDLVVNAVEIV